jgi:DNA helicase HerA-like ATPase
MRLLADPPDGAVRLADGSQLAREIAEHLGAWLAIDPLTPIGDASFDVAQLFEGDPGRTRVSIINLSALGEAGKAAFINRLQMLLCVWICNHPSPAGRLCVLDEVQRFAPVKEMTPVKRSMLALAAQGRKHGLGLIFASGSPRDLDPAIADGCVTHIFGRMNAPVSMETVGAMVSRRGRAAEDLGLLKSGEFFFSSADVVRPIKFRAPPSLSRRTPVLPGAEEATALAARRAASIQAWNKAK